MRDQLLDSVGSVRPLSACSGVKIALPDVSLVAHVSCHWFAWRAMYLEKHSMHILNCWLEARPH